MNGIYFHFHLVLNTVLGKQNEEIGGQLLTLLTTLTNTEVTKYYH